VPPHRLFLGLYAAAWAAFVSLAAASAGRLGGRLGLDGDSRAFLLFFLLLGLGGALPACVPALWRAMGRAAWLELLLAQAPLLAMLGGALVPLVFGPRSAVAARAESIGSTGVVGTVLGAPVVFLLPLGAGLVARRRARRSAAV
jgi:hypothetical protein